MYSSLPMLLLMLLNKNKGGCSAQSGCSSQCGCSSAENKNTLAMCLCLLCLSDDGCSGGCGCAGQGNNFSL